MPVSIVIGGSFGSEGKGKTALELVRRSREEVVTMRVGGADAEHISYDAAGNQWSVISASSAWSTGSKTSCRRSSGASGRAGLLRWADRRRNVFQRRHGTPI